MDPIVYKLVHPLKFGSETIEELVFKRRPTIADYDGTSSKLMIMEQMLIISRLVDKPFTVIKMMDGQDGMALMEILAGFLQPGLTTGEGASVL